MALKAMKLLASAEIERLAKLAIGAIGARVEAESRELFQKAELHFSSALKKRAEQDCEKFSRIKTLFTEGALVNLDAIYVRQRIKWGKEAVPEELFQERLHTKDHHVVIAGLAGTGKSLLLRQLFRHLAGGQSKSYPVFLELRSLKAAKYPSLLDHIATVLSSRKYKLTSEHIKIALEGGAMALLFDGFDEIDFEQRERYEDEILSIASNFKHAIIAMTSRNDPQRFQSWSNFNEVFVLPMSQEQTIELINKIDEDRELKKKFLEQARKTLFKTHGTFLGTPLLASMMLITYKRIADIPTQQHIFYREAFAALYDRHDASKGGPYARKRYAALDVDTFTKGFATFCFLTYADRVFSMPEKSAIIYIEESFLLSEHEGSPKDFLKDLLESVCVLIRDGDEVSFTHRSFQEYFTAVFLSSNRTGDHYELIQEVAARSSQDETLSMVMGINQEFLDREWVLPTIKRILETYNAGGLDCKLSHFAANIYGEIMLDGDGLPVGLVWGTPLGISLLQIKHKLYPDFFPDNRRSRNLPPKPKSFESRKRVASRQSDHITKPSIKHEKALQNSWFKDYIGAQIDGLTKLEIALKERYLKREHNLRELLSNKRKKE